MISNFSNFSDLLTSHSSLDQLVPTTVPETWCRHATVFRKPRTVRIVESHSLASNIFSGTSAPVCQPVGKKACRQADLTTFSDTKEKPFHCTCGKSFSRNDLLKRHRLREHATVSHNDDPTPSRPSSHTTVPPSPVAMLRALPNHGSTLEQSGGVTLPRETVDNIANMTSITTEVQDMHAVPNVFEEFTTFIEDAGLDPSWDGMDLSMFDPPFGQSGSTIAPAPITTASVQTLPAADPEDLIDEDFAGLTPHESHGIRDQTIYPKAFTYTWSISEAERQELSRKIAVASYPPCPIIQMPSKHALTRYFQSYADGFHKHFPMLHMPTYDIGDAPPELTLALIAVGAQYRFEFINGLELYRKARHMAMARVDQCQNHTLLPNTAGNASVCSCGTADNVCTIVLLMVFALWRNDVDLLSEALQLQAPLAHALRQDGLFESREAYDSADWHQWIRAERRRRAKLVAYAYLNLQAITYNTPPLVFANEINLSLPCTSIEWETRTSTAWQQSVLGRPPAVLFQEGLRYLLAGPEKAKSLADRPWTSPLALFILLQAVLQNIMLARHLQLPGDTALHASSLDLLEYVLVINKRSSLC